MLDAAEIRKQVNCLHLIKLNFFEKLIENLLPLPWLAASLLLAYYELYLPAISFSAFFFLTALRQSHNAFHNSLGSGRFVNRLIIFTNSILMIVSISAVKFNHLRRHRNCLQKDDYEGRAASMSWYGSLLYGPVHTFLIHRVTFQKGSFRYKAAMLCELTAISVAVSTVLYLEIDFLIYHIMVMVPGEFMMPFFAVWAVHRHTHKNPEFALTQRNRFKNLITYNMFYHLEHHLFPSVPTIKLPALAREIDKTAPGLKKQISF